MENGHNGEQDSGMHLLQLPSLTQGELDQIVHRLLARDVFIGKTSAPGNFNLKLPLKKHFELHYFGDSFRASDKSDCVFHSQRQQFREMLLARYAELKAAKLTSEDPVEEQKAIHEHVRKQIELIVTDWTKKAYYNDYRQLMKLQQESINKEIAENANLNFSYLGYSEYCAGAQQMSYPSSARDFYIANHTPANVSGARYASISGNWERIRQAGLTLGAIVKKNNEPTLPIRRGGRIISMPEKHFYQIVAIDSKCRIVLRKVNINHKKEVIWQDDVKNIKLESPFFCDRISDFDVPVDVRVRF